MRAGRQAFYKWDGPWRRCKLMEALGSRRFSHPALFQMDLRLASIMPWRGGRFFEAGAHDGYTQSNTYFLERYLGWTGVLVEPVPELRAKCECRRPHSRTFGYALVGETHDAASGASQEITMHFGDLMSSLDDRMHAASGLEVAGRCGYSISVPARTIASVLAEARFDSLDLMVLDLEGRELEALSGMDFTLCAPRYILVEALRCQEQRPSFDALLQERYEFTSALSSYDLLYKRRS